jgi:C1A family cysteine protease
LIIVPIFLVFAPPYLTAGDKLQFETQDTLEEIKAKIKHNDYSFTVEHNRIFDLPASQKEKLFNRRAPRFPRTAYPEPDIGPLARKLSRKLNPPPKFDWRDYNGHSYIGPVRDQGYCGACYAFGATAAAEGAYNRVKGLTDQNCADFSESFIAWCLSRLPEYSDHFFGCDGADYDYMELEALTQQGIINENVFPYTGTDPGACTHWDEPAVVFQSWHRVPCSDINAIKTAIMTYGVVDAAVYVTSAFEAYSSGVYEDDSTACDAAPCSDTATNHAIALVGWDDNPPEGGGGSWILRNSFGSDWGEDGYMRIRYGSARVNCAVTYIVYAIEPEVSTQPASAIAAMSADLNGVINPNGIAATYIFEYGTTTDYTSQTSVQDAGTGSDELPVHTIANDLTPQTTYHFRIKGMNASAVAYGADMTFATVGDSAAPTAITLPANNIAADSGTLNGRVNPHGNAATVWFDYGHTVRQCYQRLPKPA